MTTKGFLVTVELEIQAITCPGVWLCSNGLVSLQLFMLDSCIQTCSKKPIFPINCNEKYAFYQTYRTQHKLTDLQRQMGKEWLYVELIQWENSESGNVLASFQITLDELLFPSPSYKGVRFGADVDLLMEPTSLFPGKIAPKIEISTKTTIEETIFNKEGRNAEGSVVNPKLLSSLNTCSSKPKQTRKVCHSVQYSRARKYNKRQGNYGRRPFFCYRKAEENLIGRKIESAVSDAQPSACPKCCPPSSRSQCAKYAEGMVKLRAKQRKLLDDIEKCKSVHLRKGIKCKCGSGHSEYNCPICTKYEKCFKAIPCSCKKNMRTSLYQGSSGSERDVEQLAPCKCDKALKEKCVICDCLCDCSDNSKSLAEMIHERLAKSLASVPNVIQMPSPCGSNLNVCDCCVCVRPLEKGSENGDKTTDRKPVPECPFCKYNCIV